MLVFDSAAFGGRICASKGNFTRFVLISQEQVRWVKLEVVKAREFKYQPANSLGTYLMEILETTLFEMQQTALCGRSL